MKTSTTLSPVVSEQSHMIVTVLKCDVSDLFSSTYMKLLTDVSVVAQTESLPVCSVRLGWILEPTAAL